MQSQEKLPTETNFSTYTSYLGTTQNLLINSNEVHCYAAMNQHSTGDTVPLTLVNGRKLAPKTKVETVTDTPNT